MRNAVSGTWGKQRMPSGLSISPRKYSLENETSEKMPYSGQHLL